jgi:SAM-dependent methyltransferase
VKPQTLDLLACPSCRGDLGIEDGMPADNEIRAGRLICAVCESRYPVESGVPRLMPPEAPAERWDEWDEKQTLGRREYEDAEASGANGLFDATAAEFGAFCALSGTILDVGCGITANPLYAIHPPGSVYVGIDPLDGHVARRFEFVVGVGERLPFRDDVFDFAVAATSLDHFAAPKTVLAEVRRVLKPSGRLCVWIGVVDVKYFERMHAFPSLSDAKAWRELAERFRRGDLRHIASLAWRHLVANRIQSLSLRLRRFAGRPLPVAEVFKERARYHFHFYSENEIYGLLGECGFRVIKRRLLEDVAHGTSLFVLASPSGAQTTE